MLHVREGGGVVVSLDWRARAKLRGGGRARGGGSLQGQWGRGESICAVTVIWAQRVPVGMGLEVWRLVARAGSMRRYDWCAVAFRGAGPVR